MDERVLLARLRALINNPPDLSIDAYYQDRGPIQVWAAQSHALVSRWNMMEAIVIQSSMRSLGTAMTHHRNISNITGVVQRAIADLELRVPPEEQADFAAGEVYDFFARLHSILSSAERSVFIIDPWLDPTVFHQYVVAVPDTASIQLLSRRNIEQLREARDRFAQQYDRTVELRHHHQLHDRVVFIDDSAAFTIGQSLKDAARSIPTSIDQVAPDLVGDKLDIYRNLWGDGMPH